MPLAGSALPQFPSLPTGGLCPFRCWFAGGWFWVHSRALWVCPTDCPVRLGVSTTAATPTNICCHRFWGFSFLYWSPRFCSLSHFPIVLPSLSPHRCGTDWFTRHLLGCVSSATAALLHPFYQSGWMFNSLVVRLPWSLNFWQFLFLFLFLFLICCCPSFGCVRKWSVSTYASILARTPGLLSFSKFQV